VTIAGRLREVRVVEVIVVDSSSESGWSTVEGIIS
jgi:hypothetical protein